MVDKTSCGTCPCFFETFVFLPEHQTLSRVCYFPWDHVLVHLKIFIPMAMFIVNILWKYSMCLCLTGHKEKKSYWFFFCYTILTLYYHCTIINTWIVVNLDQKWVELGWCSSNIHEWSKSKFFLYDNTWMGVRLGSYVNAAGSILTGDCLRPLLHIVQAGLIRPQYAADKVTFQVFRNMKWAEVWNLICSTTYSP